jgi:hypothetical protein
VDYSRVYCLGCIKTLVSSEAIEEIHASDPWLCFSCSQQKYRKCLLVPKSNWQMNICSLFVSPTLSRIEKPPAPESYKTKWPLRVLSLFDGIAAGYVALKKLNIDIEVYYCSEIDEDAISIVIARHGDAIQNLGDINHLTAEKLLEISPIDLVIGGSPCNDFCKANPGTIGLSEEGSGILFFEFTVY